MKGESHDIMKQNYLSRETLVSNQSHEQYLFQWKSLEGLWQGSWIW